MAKFTHIRLTVRLEPTLIELEREQEDLLIIGHASVIRCLLAYFIGHYPSLTLKRYSQLTIIHLGLPANEVPAVEIARGDLVEIVPASYGVHSRAFHFWNGPGRTDEAETDGKEKNFYENVAESTTGKKPDETHLDAVAVQEAITNAPTPVHEMEPDN